MNTMRQTLGKFTTGVGTLVFPLYLNEPDTKFDNSEDKIKFKATIRLQGDEAAKLVKETEEHWERWLDMVKTGLGKKPKIQAKNVQWYTPDTPVWDDIGESAEKMITELQEGEAVFKMSAKANRKMRDGSFQPQTVPIYDAKLQLIPAAALPMIGFGTTAALHGQFYGWTTQAGVASLSLLLRSVQLVDVREPGAATDSPDDCGFTSTDGFVSDTDTFTDTIPSESNGDF